MIKLKLLPLGKIPDEVLDAIAEGLRSLNVAANVSLPMALPKESYNALRHQFLADAVLKFLFERFEDKVLGMTNKDLYAEGLNFVFGQAQLKGNVAVVSIHRLDPTFYKQKPDKALLIERSVKEAVHEVAHMLGMKHCDDPSCVMSFSNTIFDVDRKSKDLCKGCKARLRI